MLKTAIIRGLICGAILGLYEANKVADAAKADMPVTVKIVHEQTEPYDQEAASVAEIEPAAGPVEDEADGRLMVVEDGVQYKVEVYE